jgi:predicted transcriptional regulator
MPVKRFPLSRRVGKGAEKLLGRLELDVMRVVWTRDTVSVRDVLEILGQKRRLAYTTVMTVMSRLAEKGLLRVEKRGKTHIYQAALTREAFEAQAAGQIVQALISDFGDELALSQFVKHLADNDPEQLARLAELARQAQGTSNAD